MTNQKNNLGPTSNAKPEAKDPAGQAPTASGHKEDRKDEQKTRDPHHIPEKARGPGDVGAGDRTNKKSGV